MANHDVSRPTTPAAVVRQRPHIVSVSDGRDTVLMDVARGTYYSLNDVGGRVWQLLAEPATATDLAARLAAEYDAPEETLKADVEQLVAELRVADLITAT